MEHLPTHGTGLSDLKEPRIAARTRARMNHLHSWLAHPWALVVLCVVIAWLQSACSGGGDAAGTASTPHEPLVQVLIEPAGAHCAEGGTMLLGGLDANDDGVLETNEVQSTQYVCNSTSLQPILTALSPDLTKTHCPSGGVQVQVGQDLNGNGTLDPGEVTSVGYLCNGADGAQGPAGTNGATGATGPLVYSSTLSGGADGCCMSRVAVGPLRRRSTRADRNACHCHV